MESAELEALVLVGCLHVVAPAHESEVEHRGAHRPVFVDLIHGTQVESHTEASESGSIHIDVVNLLVCAGTCRFILLFLHLILESLHRDICLSVTTDCPFLRCREVCLHVLELEVGTCHSEEEFEFRTYSQLLVDIA